MSIANMNELCRLCLDPSEIQYKLESDFCILVMESGDSVTIADAMKFLGMEIKILPDSDDNENKSEDEENHEPKQDPENDPNLPKALCQDCLEKLQSAYEFKYRCEENRKFLRNYLKECADVKVAEERAVKEAALAALDLDIDNLDNLPDKLVLKQIKKDKKPRKPRDPSKPPIVRRRRMPEKDVIIAEDSQVDSASYVRKLVTTPEQSPEQKRGSKRKSKHVIIEDILVGGRAKPATKGRPPKVKVSESETSEDSKAERPVKKEPKSERADDEPIFEDDIEFEDEPDVKRSKRSKK